MFDHSFICSGTPSLYFFWRLGGGGGALCIAVQQLPPSGEKNDLNYLFQDPEAVVCRIRL